MGDPMVRYPIMAIAVFGIIYIILCFWESQGGPKTQKRSVSGLLARLDSISTRLDWLEEAILIDQQNGNPLTDAERRAFEKLRATCRGLLRIGNNFGSRCLETNNSMFDQTKLESIFSMLEPVDIELDEWIEKFDQLTAVASSPPSSEMSFIT